jgi:hypothetical protein
MAQDFTPPSGHLSFSVNSSFWDPGHFGQKQSRKWKWYTSAGGAPGATLGLVTPKSNGVWVDMGSDKVLDGDWGLAPSGYFEDMADALW